MNFLFSEGNNSRTNEGFVVCCVPSFTNCYTCLGLSVKVGMDSILGKMMVLISGRKGME